MRGRRRLLTGAVLAGAAAGCGRGAPLPPAPPVVDVVMREYAFDHPAHLPRGRVVFNVVNRGRLVHRLLVFPVPEDFPPIAEQVRGQERRSVTALADIPDRPPGSRASLAVDLSPGRFAFICYVVDDDGQTHARKGMVSEFRVP